MQCQAFLALARQLSQQLSQLRELSQQRVAFSPGFHASGTQPATLATVRGTLGAAPLQEETYPQQDQRWQVPREQGWALHERAGPRTRRLTTCCLSNVATESTADLSNVHLRSIQLHRHTFSQFITASNQTNYKLKLRWSFASVSTQTTP